VCDVHQGCIPGQACATTDQCVQLLGSDPCKANIFCDPASSLCMFSKLDKDGDGDPPVVCGGHDCDDGDPLTHPGAAEICDGKDNDCNGVIDDGATCPAGGTCQNGACVCPPEATCGTLCVDKQTDPAHCGDCNTHCPTGATCVGGKCACNAGATVCNGDCVDTKTDPANCNGCGNTCATGYACQSGACICLGTSCNGACVDTKTDAAHCGSCTNVCAVGQHCQNGACACPATSKVCGGVCVDVTADPKNCGNCGIACPSGNVCQNGACVGCPQPDLYLLLDLSSSMNTLITTTSGSSTRLALAKSGIDSFVAEAGLTLGVGLGYFPLANAACTASAYTPAVPIAPLPGNAAAITASVNAVALGTSSPQAPALQGALLQMRAYVAAQGNHKGAVVLITDGLPDSCTTPNVATDVAAIAATYYAGTPSIKTYVVALGGDVAVASWNAVAQAGGTGAAIDVVDVAQYKDVLNALDGVRVNFAVCQSAGVCAHDECTASTALGTGCSACATAVCLQDPFCCTNQWDAICVTEVPLFCAGKTCP
jgi:hypothetical protein